MTAAKVPAIIETYAPIGRAITGCNLLILTDGKKSIWINPHTQRRIQHQGNDVTALFNPKAIMEGSLTEEYKIKLLDLIDLASLTITSTNDDLHEVPILDPSPLAEKVWQKIWVTTGKEPEKCLYNVVEIFVFKFLSESDPKLSWVISSS